MERRQGLGAPHLVAGLGVEREQGHAAGVGEHPAGVVGDAAAEGQHGVAAAHERDPAVFLGLAAIFGQTGAPLLRSGLQRTGGDPAGGVHGEHDAFGHDRTRIQAPVAVGPLARALAPGPVQAAGGVGVLHGVRGVAVRLRPGAVHIGARQLDRALLQIGGEPFFKLEHRNPLGLGRRVRVVFFPVERVEAGQALPRAAAGQDQAGGEGDGDRKGADRH